MWAKTATVAVTASLAALVLTSCGAPSRPSAGELSATLQKGITSQSGTKIKLTEQQADCAAKIFLRSDLSDEALSKIADGQNDNDPSKADQAALDKIAPDLTTCATS